ncbi:MAG TPA: dienelactone hydrolase family protein [Burkholderiaceae bacterium]|nr:dienelactone hydrolase family protein [Burkholderiaceae bacterium]HQR72055.1 dienelactone hydrolase family protein [Burkholderiaceae bacterium]
MKLDLEPDIKGLLPDRSYDRRDFIWTALGASAALAVSAPVSAQQITTDTEGLDAADVMIPTPTGDLRGYRAMPAKGGPFPVVLVAAEIFGLNHYMKDVCRRLAKAGYYAIVPDLYTRKADLTKFKSMEEIRPIVNTKYDSELISDYDATVDFVRADSHGDLARMAITGFCRGGRTPLVYAASNPKLRAVVAWYGPVGGAVNEYTPRTVMDRAAEIKAPVLGLYGAKDAGVPIAEVEKFFAALKAAGTPCELVTYPEAGHGFHADFRADSYRKADAEDGWRRMLDWFRKYGV